LRWQVDFIRLVSRDVLEQFFDFAGNGQVCKLSWIVGSRYFFLFVIVVIFLGRLLLLLLLQRGGGTFALSLLLLLFGTLVGKIDIHVYLIIFFV
jgi:hypothetical protein